MQFFIHLAWEFLRTYLLGLLVMLGLTVATPVSWVVVLAASSWPEMILMPFLLGGFFGAAIEIGRAMARVTRRVVS